MKRPEICEQMGLTRTQYDYRLREMRKDEKRREVGRMAVYKEKRCGRCGAAFISSSGNAKFCPECRPIMHRAAQLRWNETKRLQRLAAHDAPEEAFRCYDSPENISRCLNCRRTDCSSGYCVMLTGEHVVGKRG